MLGSVFDTIVCVRLVMNSVGKKKKKKPIDLNRLFDV